jgi:hypothetical protein
MTIKEINFECMSAINQMFAMGYFDSLLQLITVESYEIYYRELT